MKNLSIIIKIILFTIILLVILEIIARLIFGTPSNSESELIPDPILNHIWKPNLEHTEIGRGILPFILYTNGQSWVGRTDISIVKPKNTVRVFYMGDSNVQGVVGEGKKMTEIVGKELNNKYGKNGKQFEIVNTGTSSWSPSLYYLLIKNKILKYSPDVVVINVDMTDVRDDSIYRKLTKFDDDGLPLAVRPSDEVLKASYKIAPQGILEISSTEQFINMLRKNSALYYDTERLYASLSKNEILRKIFFKPPTSTTPPISNNTWIAPNWNEEGRKDTDYSMFLLAHTIKLLKEHNVKVIITGVPHYPQYTGEWSSRPHEILSQTAKKHDALYLNSYEALKGSIKGSSQTKYYWDVDPTHFNEEGNKIWAKAQVDFMLNHKEELLLF